MTAFRHDILVESSHWNSDRSTCRIKTILVQEGCYASLMPGKHIFNPLFIYIKLIIGSQSFINSLYSKFILPIGFLCFFHLCFF